MIMTFTEWIKKKMGGGAGTPYNTDHIDGIWQGALSDIKNKPKKEELPTLKCSTCKK